MWSQVHRSDENDTSNPSHKTNKEGVVYVSDRVYSGPIVDVDNNEHQSMEVELNKEKKGDKDR